VSTRYAQAGEEAVQRTMKVLGDVGELFGAKREQPPVLLLGAIACPPPVRVAPPSPVTAPAAPAVSPPSILASRQAG
jgi:hypothetical protein